MQGALCGFIASVITHPLDVVCTQIQRNGRSTKSTINHIWRSQGWKGFYVGCRFNFVISPIYYGFLFPAYSIMKTKMSSSLAGVISAMICSFIVNPLYVLKVREQNSLVNKCNISPRSILTNEGIASFYKGYGITVMKSLELGVQMPVYEKLKDVGISPGISMFIARCTVNTFFYPSEVIRLRLRNDGNSFAVIFQSIVKERCWYAGFVTYSIKSVTKACIVFALYDVFTLTSKTLRS